MDSVFTAYSADYSRNTRDMHEQQQCDLERNLSLAVEQIQEQFSRSSAAIIDSTPVTYLCQCVEDILQHGLKERLLHWASLSEVTFWPLVLRVTCKEAVEEITRLGLLSDAARCQVWIRQAVRENTLGSYFNVISQDRKLLKEFYHPHAFLNNTSKVEAAKSLLIYGISSFDFEIAILPSVVENNFPVEKMSLCSDYSVTGVPEREVLVNGKEFHSCNSRRTDKGMFFPRGNSNKQAETRKKKKKKKTKTSVVLIADGDVLSEDQVEKPDKENSEKSVGTAEIRDKRLEQEEFHDGVVTGRISHTVQCTSEAQRKMHEMEVVPSSTRRNIVDNEPSQIRDNLEEEEFEDGIVTGGVSHTVQCISEAQIQIDEPEVIPSSTRRNIVDSEPAEMREKHLEEEEFRDGIVTGEVSHTVQCTSEAQRKIDELTVVPSSTRRNIVVNGQSKLASGEEDASLLSLQRTSLEVRNGDNQQLSKEPARFLNENKNELRFNTIESYLGVDGGPDVLPQAVPAPCTRTHLHDGNKFTDATNMERNKSAEESSITDNHLSDLGAENVSVERRNIPQEKRFTVGENQLGNGREEFYSTGYAGYEEEDYNFVPGIHRQEDELSISSSFNSFTGSESFRNGRGDTFDSCKSRTSTGNSEGMKVESGYCASTGQTSLEAVETDSVSRDDSLSDFVLFEELLGVDEDHFSPPESFMGVSTSEELRHAIQGCKDLIRCAPENSVEKKKLVEKLIMLRMRLQEAQETPIEEDSNVKKVLGHQFLKEEATSANPHCDKCGKVIWTMWQSDFVCKDCRFHSHRKCLDMIRRPCASRKVSEASYILRICPETGLSSQQYKCAECRKRISLTKGDESEARLCDNTGQYFCVDCHWNDTLIIPARVIHNWDFAPRKVARQTKQLLDLMQHRPTMNVEKLNPTLLKYIGELREIKRLREEVLIMKKYFLSCQEARESKLLLKLQGRQHFVDSSELYSLQDLIDVNNGSLLPFLTRVHSLFLTHIKTECETCRGKGFLCEICKLDEVIFAFDPHALQCTGCKSVFHKLCFKSTSCPRCERRRQRSQKHPNESDR